jgi:hypothetical protein
VEGLPAGTYHLSYSTTSTFNTDLSDQTIGTGGTISTSMPAAGVLTIFADAPIGIPLFRKARLSRMGGELDG